MLLKEVVKFLDIVDTNLLGYYEKKGCGETRPKRTFLADIISQGGRHHRVILRHHQKVNHRRAAESENNTQVAKMRLPQRVN